MKDIILAGVQGSGKGTQADILIKKYWYKYFETGKELRIIAESESELGKKVKNIMNSWWLVDTDIIMEIVEAFCFNLKDNESVIFDWIPRNLEQMEKFEEVMKKINRKPSVLHISLDKEIAINRVLWRFECVWVDTTNTPLITEQECVLAWGTVKKRSDDNSKAVEERINNFYTQTIPAIDEYEKEDRVIDIKWNQSVKEVTAEIKAKLEL